MTVKKERRRVSTASLVNNEAFRDRRERYLGRIHSSAAEFPPVKTKRKHYRAEEFVDISISAQEEEVFRDLIDKEEYSRFVQNYYRFLTIAKTIPEASFVSERVSSLSLAEIVYNELKTDEIQHPNYAPIQGAMRGIRRDYPVIMDFINRDRRK